MHSKIKMCRLGLVPQATHFYFLGKTYGVLVRNLRLQLSKVAYSPKMGIEIINCVPCPNTDSQIKFPR